MLMTLPTAKKAAFFSALDLATGRGATVRNGNGLPALNLHKFAALNGFGAVQNNFSAQAGGVCAGSKQRRAGLRGKRHALDLVYGDQCGAHAVLSGAANRPYGDQSVRPGPSSAGTASGRPTVSTA
jgi:hypothetical protein